VKRRQVIKLGGSLLNRPSLAEDLQAWLSLHPARQTGLVIGGGQIIEAVRRLDAVHHLDARGLHWHCVDLMHATFKIGSELLDDFVPLDDPPSLERWLADPVDDPARALVSPRCFYRRDRHPDVLPQDWSTTSDSIAALLAGRIAADRLVLLKSCEVDPAAPIDSLSAAGIVDEAFSATLGDVSFTGEALVRRLPRTTQS